eukprot:COSAG05_NODE_8190_length_728_cov_0.850556_1_plen_125_part_00
MQTIAREKQSKQSSKKKKKKKKKPSKKRKKKGKKRKREISNSDSDGARSDTDEDSEESIDDSLVAKKTEVEEIEPGPQQLPQMSLDYGGALLPGEVSRTRADSGQLVHPNCACELATSLNSIAG